MEVYRKGARKATIESYGSTYKFKVKIWELRLDDETRILNKWVWVTSDVFSNKKEALAYVRDCIQANKLSLIVGRSFMENGVCVTRES